MMYPKVGFGAAVFVCSLIAQAGAQGAPATVSGTAFGSRVSLLGTLIDRRADTDIDPDTDGTCHMHTAAAPGSFECTGASETVIPVPGLLNVATFSDSTARGDANLADPCASTVTSTAGMDSEGDCSDAADTQNAIVEVVPGPTPLLRVVTTCARAKAEGANLSGRSFVSAVEINGNAIPVAGSTETTILPEDLAPIQLIRLNHSESKADEAAGTAHVRQDALIVQALDDKGEIVQVVVSSASADIKNLPRECFENCPSLDVIKEGGFTPDGDHGCPGSPDADDMIQYSVTVGNGGLGDAKDLKIVDRVPLNMDDPSTDSIEFDDPSAEVSVENCPAGQTFAGCPGDSDKDRRCVVVKAASLAKGETRTLNFTARVKSRGTACNSVVASAEASDPTCTHPPASQEKAFIIPEDPSCPGDTPTPTPTRSSTPQPPPIATRTPPQPPTHTPKPEKTQSESGAGATGDVLKTTGSGGCSLAPSESLGDGWPMLLLATLLVLRRRRRR